MTKKSLVLAGTSLAALAVPAAAADTGWYVGVGNGLSVPGNISAKWVSGSTTTQSASLKLDPTWRGTASFGFATRFHLRLEGEVSYTHPNFGTPASALMHVERSDLRLVGAGVNVHYDLPFSRDWSVTFGVGAGYSRSRLGSTSFAYTADGPSGQLIAGAIYRLSDSIDLQFDYRYAAARRLVYKGAGGTGTNVKYDWAGSHNLMFTLRLFFDGSPQQAVSPAPVRQAPPPRPVAVQRITVPPPPPPITVPSPVAAPPASTYILYFDFDSTELDETAAAIVAKAVQAAKAGGMVKILITGHTDTVGSERYNVMLSTERARAVQEEMERLGLEGPAIAILGAGYHDPAVSTGPGVREPQNRRAVIQFVP